MFTISVTNKAYEISRMRRLLLVLRLRRLFETMISRFRLVARFRQLQYPAKPLTGFPFQPIDRLTKLKRVRRYCRQRQNHGLEQISITVPEAIGKVPLGTTIPSNINTTPASCRKSFFILQYLFPADFVF